MIAYKTSKYLNPETIQNYFTITENFQICLCLDASEKSISTSPENNSKETSPAAENSSPESAADLAEIFQNCTIYFHNFKDSVELKKLSRYVIAYDGDVDKTMTSYTTHIITSDDVIDNDDMETLRKAGLPVVSKEWISECVKRRILVDTKNFIVDLSSTASKCSEL